jgi:hypothetical protein
MVFFRDRHKGCVTLGREQRANRFDGLHDVDSADAREGRAVELVGPLDAHGRADLLSGQRGLEVLRPAEFLGFL